MGTTDGVSKQELNAALSSALVELQREMMRQLKIITGEMTMLRPTLTSIASSAQESSSAVGPAMHQLYARMSGVEQKIEKVVDAAKRLEESVGDLDAKLDRAAGTEVAMAHMRELTGAHKLAVPEEKLKVYDPERVGGVIKKMTRGELFFIWLLVATLLVGAVAAIGLHFKGL